MLFSPLPCHPLSCFVCSARSCGGMAKGALVFVCARWEAYKCRSRRSSHKVPFQSRPCLCVVFLTRKKKETTELAILFFSFPGDYSGFVARYPKTLLLCSWKFFRQFVKHIPYIPPQASSLLAMRGSKPVLAVLSLFYSLIYFLDHRSSSGWWRTECLLNSAQVTGAYEGEDVLSECPHGFCDLIPKLRKFQSLCFLFSLCEC